MQKIITYDTLRNFAYSNDLLIKQKIRGIVLNFCGLNATQMRQPRACNTVRRSCVRLNVNNEKIIPAAKCFEVA